MSDFKLKYKDILILAVLIAILGFLSIGALQEYQKNIEISRLSDELKLKAPAENIVQYTEYDSNGRPLNVPSADNSDANDNNTIKYIYRTNIVVPEATYNGLKEDITQRTPNAQIFLKSEKQVASDKIEKTYVGKFYSGVNFSKSGDKWYKTEVGITKKSAFLKQIKPTLFVKVKGLLGQNALAENFYIVNTGDGYAKITGSPGSWLEARNASVGDVSNSTSSLMNVMTSSFLANLDIYRVFLPFDTSAIPSIATIQAAELYVYVSGAGSDDNDGSDYINVIQTSQPSATTLTTADYDNAIETEGTGVPTEGATAIDLTSGFVTSAYNFFTLNSTGLAWVKKSGQASNCGGGTGVTCLGLREGHDIEANHPIVSSSEQSITISTYDSGSPPYLIVTYNVSVPAVNINGGTVKIDSGTFKVNSN